VARKDISMTPAEVTRFLAGGHTLTVATIGPRGAPHVVPMWYVLRDGKVVFRSFTKSQKIANLRRDPRLTVLVEEGRAYQELRGVVIEGRATLIADPSFVLEIYGEESRRYAFVGDAPVPLEGEALEAAFGRFAVKNTAVVVEPERVSSWDHRKLGGGY
jgi:PPOX class probable F420-dependent enzyme